jgi:hypothetical protein
VEASWRETAKLTFFQATATVLPVFLLTLAVGARFFVPRPSPASPLTGWQGRLVVFAGPRFYGFQVVLVFAVGEFYSLRALSSGELTAWATRNTWAALVSGFIAV